jgi:hypothetical protein
MRLPFALCLSLAIAFFLVGSGCVPREPREERRTSSSPAAARPMDAVQPVAPAAPPAADDAALDGPFSDSFDRAELGPAWRSTSPLWSLSEGRLCGENARNHPVWLRRRLPTNASIEFQATSFSPDGDIKAEFWGDGRSSASGQSYTDATSYLTIFGGWQNHFHVLARIDEHAPDRQAIKLEPGKADFTTSTVVPKRVYQFQVERRDGRTVRWRVDGVEILTYRDAQPLVGLGHEHFGFNDWQVRVCFDNLRVMPVQD